MYKIFAPIVKHVPAPSVPRKVLVFGAGFLWVVIGAFMIYRAVGISYQFGSPFNYPILIGFIIGYVKHQFVFSKIVKRNLERIRELAPHKSKICLFAFQPMQAYLIVMFMVSLGILIKQLGLPDDLRMVIFTMVGTALFLSGIRYFRAIPSV